MLAYLKKDLISVDISYFTSKWIIDRTPFIFTEAADEYLRWKEQLAAKLGVDSKGIVLTGSSAIGFSLNPDKNLRPFNENSDIDVAVVSDHHFDISWHFLRNLGTKMYKYTQREKNAIDDHRTRLIYWGTIATDKIIQILPFGQAWVGAAEAMATTPPVEGRQLNFRIYKDFDALRTYHKAGLKFLKDKIILE